MTIISTVTNALLSQPPSLGAQPQLYAAVEADLAGGELIGPKYVMFGSPVVETADFCQLDLKKETPFCTQDDIDALWAQSEVLSGVTY